MRISLSSRAAVAVLTCGLALCGPALAPASAEIRHGGGYGGHRGGGWHGHYAGRYRHYGYHGGYYGGYYGGYGYYGGCIPVLGLVSGNFCGY